MGGCLESVFCDDGGWKYSRARLTTAWSEKPGLYHRERKNDNISGSWAAAVQKRPPRKAAAAKFKRTGDEMTKGGPINRPALCRIEIIGLAGRLSTCRPC